MYGQKDAVATNVTITENMLVHGEINRPGNERAMTVNVFLRAWLGERDRLTGEPVQVVEKFKELRLR